MSGLSKSNVELLDKFIVENKDAKQKTSSSFILKI